MTKVTDLKRIPKDMDKAVISEWIGKNSEVVKELPNEFNYCLFLKDDENSTGGSRGLNLSSRQKPVRYRFIRFFTGGNETHASVDWEGTEKDAIVKLADMLQKEFD